MPRQKWRGISIFGMTNHFEPPKKLALGDADLAAALEATQGEEGSLGAMQLLETQSELRAQDSLAYVRWVREMESLGTLEAKDALSAARRGSSGLTPEPAVERVDEPVTETSWQALVPDWDDRQQAVEVAKEKAVADAIALAEERAKEEIDAAVAAAIAEAEFEAEVKREEVVAKVVAEAEALAAEKLAQEIRIAEELAEVAALAAEQERIESERVEAERAELQRVEDERLENERLEAERIENEALEAQKLEDERVEAERAEQQRVEDERLENERIEAERIENEALEAQKLEDERVEAERAELQRVEDERLESEALEAAKAEQVMREEIERAELAELEALIAAEEDAARSSAQNEATPLEEEVEAESEPDPVRASDFATGSFDIVESAEQAASEDFDEDSFEVLLNDGELGFAKEPISRTSDSPISTIDRRAKPYSQLFVWSSLSVGLLPILFAYLSISLELSFADKVLGLFAGLTVSALLIAVAAIGGKRSGLPTLYLSRAAFGVKANYVPAIALVAVKFVFGATLPLAGLALFDGAIVGAPAVNEPVFAGSAVSFTWLLATFAALLVLAAVLAFFGGKVLYFAQLGIASIGALVSLGFAFFTAPQISLDSSDLTFSNNWMAVVALAVLVSVVFGGFWISSVAEFTRKVSMAQSGKKLALFVALSAGVLPLIFATYSLMVSSSLAEQFEAAALKNPMGALLAAVPAWFASGLLVSGLLSLMIWAAAWLYSTSVSLAAISIRLRPAISQPILVLATLAIGYSLVTFSSAPFNEIFDAVIAVSGVIAFAWAGVFISDVSLRRIAYHEVSLTRDYGFYKSVNAVNLGAFVVAVAIGLGFVSSTLVGLEWFGYLAGLVDAQPWADANIGVLISLGFTLLFPILFGRKRIREQESEVLAIESRKRDLEHVDLDEI